MTECLVKSFFLTEKKVAFRSREEAEVSIALRPSVSLGEKTPSRGLPVSLVNWGNGEREETERIALF